MKHTGITRLLSVVAVCLVAFEACNKETIDINDPAICDGVLLMNPGAKHEILYNVDPAGTSVSWSSSCDDVAVAYSGIVEARTPGFATISGTTSSGSSASFTVNVQPYEVTYFQIPSAFSVYVGQTAELPVTEIAPELAGPSSIAWHSSEGGVISWKLQDGKLLVTGKSRGKTEFIGKGVEGVERTCVVTVNDVELSLSEEKLSLGTGESRTIVLKQKPDGILKDFVWSSSDKSVATVEGLDKGKATITAGGTGGQATISVKVAAYTLSLPVIVVSDDFQPYVKTPLYADQFHYEDKWPCNLIREEVIPDGGTIYVLPRDLYASWGYYTDGYAYPDKARIYTGACLENGGELPASLRESLTASFSDPDGVFPESYIGSGNGSFYVRSAAYKPGKATLSVSTRMGKTHSCNFQYAVKKIGISAIMEPDGMRSWRENVVTVNAGDKITLKLSQLDVSRAYSVDLSAMEFQGYAPVKANLVKSSNTAVVSVSNATYHGIAAEVSGLRFKGKGTTTITISNESKTISLQFQLEVTD